MPAIIDCNLTSIDDKNINLQIENIKKHVSH